MKTSFALAALLPACATAFLAPAPLPAATAARTRSVGVSMMAERSKSLPFLLKPKNLDGSMAGDVGFDPLVRRSRVGWVERCRLCGRWVDHIGSFAHLPTYRA